MRFGRLRTISYLIGAIVGNPDQNTNSVADAFVDARGTLRHGPDAGAVLQYMAAVSDDRERRLPIRLWAYGDR